ncbi:hypothetical protein [Robinsoniella peoriensis]|uniref:hypothetical protein n=1 Tax=Robinsoniella peoriensis TaxID=180332 RepID=UPI003626B580
MRKALAKNKGASMLLAICIFMVLAVIGFNVLAAASANTYNSRGQLTNEQAIQYVNSIYEIVDGMIQDGEFNLDACLEEEGTEVSGMTAVLGTNNLEDSNGNKIDVSIKFARDTNASVTQKNRIKAQITINYKARDYCITSIYLEDKSLPEQTKYTLIKCEGVVSSDNE